jgi:hypothetical protein
MSDIAFRAEDLPLYQALVPRLMAKGDFRGVERATRTMLLALAGKGRADVERDLWRRLRSLYRDHLDDRKGAIVAAQTIVELWPGNHDDILTLARLFAEDAQLETADDYYWAALTGHPMDVVALRELVALRGRREKPDEAWAAINVLGFVDTLTDEERAFHEARTPRGLPTGQLDRDAWDELAPGAAVSKIFTALAPAIFRASQDMPFTTERRDPRFVPREVESPLFRAAFARANRAFGFPEYAHFADPDPTAPHPDLEGPIDDAMRELLFVAGRQAAFHRPAHLVLFHHFAVEELYALLWSGHLATDPKAQVPPALYEVATKTASYFRAAMTPQASIALADAFRAFLRFEEGKSDLRMWRDLQNIYAARAGLLLCGDLEVAERVLESEPEPPDVQSVDKVMLDLRVFAITRRFVRLRKRLGLGADLVVH